MAAATPPPVITVSNTIIAPLGTILSIGDIVTGQGFQSGTIVVSITSASNSRILITLNQPLWVGAAPSSVTGDPGDATAPTDWYSTVSFSSPKVQQTLSFKEDIKGWVSFKSFIPESALSMASDYYSMFGGKLHLHHDEFSLRNNFYGIGYNSSVNVLLNDSPGIIKTFNTLNYEGSQSRVVQDLSNFPQTYNTIDKSGWFVSGITTNKQEGTLPEFIEKEGKWFNYIVGFSNLTSPELIVNGNFDNGDVGWNTTEVGWGVGAGVAMYSGTDYNYIEQRISGLIAGKTYRITFTNTTTSIGGNEPIVVYLGGTTTDAPHITSTGVQIVDLEAGTDSSYLRLYAGMEMFVRWNGTIDNVSVREFTVDSIPDISAFNVQGIGPVVGISGNTITFGNINFSVQIGDVLHSQAEGELGLVDGLNMATNTITIVPTVPPKTITQGDFVFFEKNRSINTSSLLGYYADVKLENNSSNKIELFSIGSDVSESSK